MGKIILYSIPNCPQCSTVKSLFKMNNVIYEEVMNIDLMKSKGFMSAPMLEVNNQPMCYEEILDWVKHKYNYVEVNNNESN